MKTTFQSDNCPYRDDEDGTCGHPRNLTPECHEHICPLLRGIKNHPTPSEIGFQLNLASYTARAETEDLERVWHVKTPAPNLLQMLRQAKTVVVEALGG